MKPNAATRRQIGETLKKRRGIRTTSGVRETTPWLYIETIERQCDAFFRSRGMSTTETGYIHPRFQ
jgi:hypothetical protein